MDINIIKIQKVIRGFLCRIKRLPLFLYIIQNYLSSILYSFSVSTEDGRVNSFIDENNIIKILCSKYCERIKVPKIRMWYDILIYDKLCGWLPVNIKSTSTKTRDNTGNLAMCVYAYTNQKLDLHKTYENGKMSHIFIEKLRAKEYNKNFKKDYYFLVFNKQKPKDIIINSVKGLKIIHVNNNNLPFQVCWNKNRNYEYNGIINCIGLLLCSMEKIKHNWKKNFIDNIKNINKKRKRICNLFIQNKRIKL